MISLCYSYENALNAVLMSLYVMDKYETLNSEIIVECKHKNSPMLEHQHLSEVSAESAEVSAERPTVTRACPTFVI